MKIDPSAIEYCSQAFKKQLRITCYGSSSSKTPERYLDAARSLGYILAKRGHICVNGAGQYGCMAAMNDGAMAGNGHIVGVIHEMFLVDGGYWEAQDKDRSSFLDLGPSDGGIYRDGGAHEVFNDCNSKSREEDAPIREILVAKGDDLQERKRLLVQNADALIVLPGGPGTWDELWEMACIRNLGLTKLPIVCVDVDDYYEPFREMLARAYEDKLIGKKPEEIVHFAKTPEQAIRWVEAMKEEQEGSTGTTVDKRKRDLMNSGSFYSGPAPIDEVNESEGFDKKHFLKSIADACFSTVWSAATVAFTIGLTLGISISRSKS